MSKHCMFTGSYLLSALPVGQWSRDVIHIMLLDKTVWLACLIA